MKLCRNGRPDRFQGAQLASELRELHPALPSSESDELADCAQLADLLANQLAVQSPEPPPLRREDGRSRRASFKSWLREHAPLVYLGLYREPDDELATAAERRRRRELEELARVRRAALAYCIECRNPLVATEYGFQYCPYERAGQHAKVSQARSQHQVMAGRARAREAARDTAGRFAPMESSDSTLGSKRDRVG
jgi:hypothetical protein